MHIDIVAENYIIISVTHRIFIILHSTCIHTPAIIIGHNIAK